MTTFHIDRFSGAASDLKKGHRTAENVLAALRREPRVSTWDMSEHYSWLPSLIDDLKQRGALREVPSEFPWIRYEVINAAPQAQPEAAAGVPEHSTESTGTPGAIDAAIAKEKQA